MQKKIYFLITILFSIIFLLIFGIVLTKQVSLRFDIPFLFSNFLILLFMLIFVLVLVILGSRKEKFFPNPKCIIILTILLFSFELLLIIGIPFKTGWDAGLIFDAAYYNDNLSYEYPYMLDRKKII